MIRTLTGIQPSGALHIGNYFGAMRPAIDAQAKGECFYFIADYHSMTSLLDPPRSVFWRQSDVPGVTELSWIVGTLTPMGLLERATSYKDKVAKGISPNFGLFAYPVLMASDILLFDTNVVPVGRDEIAVVPGLDGQKMSKSYGNTIDIFGEEKTVRKKIMGIVMDSRTPQEPKPDADKNLAIHLLRLVAPPGVAADFENRLRAGGLGYGDLKKALFEHYWNYFAAARTRRAELAANLDHVNRILADGAERARAVAQVVLRRARKASGLE